MRTLTSFGRLFMLGAIVASLSGCLAGIPVGVIAAKAMSPSGQQQSERSAHILVAGERVRYWRDTTRASRVIGTFAFQRADTVFVNEADGFGGLVPLLAGKGPRRPEVVRMRRGAVGASVSAFVVGTLGMVAGGYVHARFSKCAAHEMQSCIPGGGIVAGGVTGMMLGTMWGVREREEWEPIRTVSTRR